MPKVGTGIFDIRYKFKIWYNNNIFSKFHIIFHSFKSNYLSLYNLISHFPIHHSTISCTLFQNVFSIAINKTVTYYCDYYSYSKLNLDFINYLFCLKTPQYFLYYLFGLKIEINSDTLISVIIFIYFLQRKLQLQKVHYFKE